MKRANTQAGFAFVLEIIIVAIVMSGIAFTTYRVQQAKQNNSAQSTAGTASTDTRSGSEADSRNVSEPPTPTPPTAKPAPAPTPQPSPNPSPALGSGFGGRAMYGPTCGGPESYPPNPDCADKPYVTTFILKNSSGQEVLKFTSDSAGYFGVDVAPGNYTIVVANPSYLDNSPRPVGVTGSKHTQVNLSYDTGIR